MNAASVGAGIACAVLAAGCGDRVVEGDASGAASAPPSSAVAPSTAAHASAASVTSSPVASAPTACPRPPDGASLGAHGFRDHGWPIEAGDVSPSGARLVVSNNFGELLWIDVATWSVVGRLTPVNGERHLTPRFLDEERVVTCGIDEKVQVRQAQGDVTAWATPPGTPECRDVLVDRRAGRTASVHYPDLTGRDARVVLFDAEGRELASARSPARYGGALSGDWLTAEDGERRVVVGLRPDVEGAERAPFVGVESRGRLLSPGPAGQLRLLQAAEGAASRHTGLPRAGGVPRTGAFTPDGRGLFVFYEAATSSGTSGLALLDASTLAERRFEPLHWASAYRFDDRGCGMVVFDGVEAHFFDPVTGTRRATAAVARAR